MSSIEIEDFLWSPFPPMSLKNDDDACVYSFKSPILVRHVALIVNWGDDQFNIIDITSSLLSKGEGLYSVCDKHEGIKLKNGLGILINKIKYLDFFEEFLQFMNFGSINDTFSCFSPLTKQILEGNLTQILFDMCASYIKQYVPTHNFLPIVLTTGGSIMYNNIDETRIIDNFLLNSALTEEFFLSKKNPEDRYHMAYSITDICRFRDKLVIEGGVQNPLFVMMRTCDIDMNHNSYEDSDVRILNTIATHSNDMDGGQYIFTYPQFSTSWTEMKDLD